MVTYGVLTDQELAALMKKGDREAYTEIYRRYWALLLQHALGMLRNQDEAKDAVQDVFQMLWEKAEGLDIHTSLSSFLYTSTRYRVLKQFKHSKVADRYLSTLQNEIEKGVATTDLKIEEQELFKKIEAGLNKLPPRMREVFELSRIHDQSYRQIAETLNLTDNTVKRQISNALKIMRDTINKGFSVFF